MTLAIIIIHLRIGTKKEEGTETGRTRPTQAVEDTIDQDPALLKEIEGIGATIFTTKKVLQITNTFEEKRARKTFTLISKKERGESTRTVTRSSGTASSGSPKLKPRLRMSRMH